MEALKLCAEIGDIQILKECFESLQAEISAEQDETVLSVLAELKSFLRAGEEIEKELGTGARSAAQGNRKTELQENSAQYR